MPGSLLLRLHPPTGPAHRHGRANLQAAELAAPPAPHRDRKAAIAEAGRNHRGQIEFCPSVAARAVGVEPVPVLEQAGEGAEVDHAASVARTAAHIVSRTARSALSKFLTDRGAAGARPAPPDRVNT